MFNIKLTFQENPKGKRKLQNIVKRIPGVTQVSAPRTTSTLEILYGPTPSNPNPIKIKRNIFKQIVNHVQMNYKAIITNLCDQDNKYTHYTQTIK